MCLASPACAWLVLCAPGGTLILRAPACAWSRGHGYGTSGRYRHRILRAACGRRQDRPDGTESRTAGPPRPRRGHCAPFPGIGG